AGRWPQRARLDSRSRGGTAGAATEDRQRAAGTGAPLVENAQHRIRHTRFADQELPRAVFRAGARICVLWLQRSLLRQPGYCPLFRAGDIEVRELFAELWLIPIFCAACWS